MGVASENKPKERRNRVGTILIVLGVIFILTGAGIYIYKQLENYFAIQESTNTVGLLTDAISSSTDAGDSLIIDGKGYVGIIEIPSINLTLPVLASCENGNDKLVFYDTHSNKKEYKLVKTEILLPENIKQFTTSEYGVTLFTCYWDNYQRYVLRFN